jgi:PIN domain nuclease of toxin-antitoxin system
MKYLLDTHTWIWWHINPDQLSLKVKNLILHKHKYDELLLSAISTWEFCMLIKKGRIGISCDPLFFIEEALNMPKLRLVALTPLIAYKSTILPESFHSDPADQIIISTAREENATILTKDQRILSSQYVKSFW